MGDGLNSAVVIIERKVLVGGVGIFVGQTETDEHARHLKGIVHLRDERNGAPFANEHRFFPKALLKRGLRHVENGVVISR